MDAPFYVRLLLLIYGYVLVQCESSVLVYSLQLGFYAKIALVLIAVL